MSVQLLRLGIMDEDQLIEQALDQFINRHEQTYEEFLNTFTHLSKDHHMRKNRMPGIDSSGNSFAWAVHPHSRPIRSEHLSPGPVAQPPEEEQIVIDEGQKVGISIQGDLNRAGKVKVDNFLDLEDFDMGEETDHKLSRELLLLPGEVEEEVSGDEVQPFSLDEDFDYDSVMLTPKFSSAEMKTIIAMSSQSRPNPGTEAGEPNN